jgi:hypothetical protein
MTRGDLRTVKLFSVAADLSVICNNGFNALSNGID